MISKRTSAIVLRRVNYGEADRILTLLTKDYGKMSLMAKGVRREKSKLAGGIELFSESDISFIQGRGEVGTLVSTQLVRHFSNIHVDLERMKIASDIIKKINNVTEDDASYEYYDLAIDMMVAINTPSIEPSVVGAWSIMRLLHLLGEVINIESDSTGNTFSDSQQYRFSYEDGRFVADSHGTIAPTLIKFLRLLGHESPARIMAVRGAQELGSQAYELLQLAYQYNRPNYQALTT